jgi:hypothetical protein
MADVSPCGLVHVSGPLVKKLLTPSEPACPDEVLDPDEVCPDAVCVDVWATAADGPLHRHIHIASRMTHVVRRVAA